MLKILVDENIPRTSVKALRDSGHDVMDLRGSEKEGISDSQVWSIAQEQKRLLITTDKWFATNRTSSHAGILIIALKHPNRQKIHDRIILALQRFIESEWLGLTVVMRDNVLSVRREH